MTQITSARIHYNEQGTPVSDAFDDVYFSNESGLHETQYVFVDKNRLVERWPQTSESTLSYHRNRLWHRPKFSGGLA